MDNAGHRHNLLMSYEVINLYILDANELIEHDKAQSNKQSIRQDTIDYVPIHLICTFYNVMVRQVV